MGKCNFRFPFGRLPLISADTVIGRASPRAPTTAGAAWLWFLPFSQGTAPGAYGAFSGLIAGLSPLELTEACSLSGSEVEERPRDVIKVNPS